MNILPNKITRLRGSKTPLMNLVRQAFQMARRSFRKNAMPIDEMSDARREHLWTRRRFVQQSTAAVLALGTASLLPSCKDEPVVIDDSRKIAIIGGGMAGLHASHLLKKAGFASLIFEGSLRAGGRMYTAKNLMGQGLTTELGGEFIDSIHEDMLNLVDEFGLELLDTQSASELLLTKDAYFFDNQHYSLTEVIEAFQSIVPAVEADINSLPDFISYEEPGTAVNFDNRSVSQYLTDIGASGWLKNLLEIAFLTEYGLEADQQSCINMLYLISTDTSNGAFDVFGESDERYKIKGGNQQLVDKLAESVAEYIRLGHQLIAVKQSANNTYELTFDIGGGDTLTYISEFVIMTLPFSVLRDVDLSQAGLPAKKMEAIQQLGYGTNAKLFLGFDDRHWRSLGYTGYLFTDNGIQTGWDNSQLQEGTVGSYTIYTGGNVGVAVGDGSAQSQADLFLPKLDSIFAGCAGKYTGTAERFHWPTHAFTKGSYACYKIGQWTSIAGAEQQTVGKMFFAGEHCSFDYQGYMNGAAETGRVAAEAIIALLG